MSETTSIARLWGQDWQVWRVAPKGGVWKRDLSAADEMGGRGMLSAIPARKVVAVPFWVESIESEMVRSIALLEVEMKGVVGPERMASQVVIRPLRTEKERTLVRAEVYPSDWPEGTDSRGGEAYEPTPLLSKVGGDTVHLWRENDDLVAVVSWNGEIVCWETHSWPAPREEIAGWLRCLMLQLRSDLQIAVSFGLKEWTPVFEGTPPGFTRENAADSSGQMEGPPIRLPVEPGNWLPPSQVSSTQDRRKKEVVSAALLGLGFLLLCAIAAVLFLQWDTSRKIAAREMKIAQLEQETAPVREAAAQWERIEAAVDDQFHPIEVLHVVVKDLPKSGVRLTRFDMTPEKLQIEGEAQNVAAAAEYFRRLREDPEAIPGLVWEMPPPSLQNDNRARFQINGGRSHGQ